MARVLITGSRDWDDSNKIIFGFNDIVRFFGEGPHVLVSGACPTGADIMCEEYAKHLGWPIERHPADWETHGKKAGFVRNAEMVNLGADICLAFIKGESKGATMTADMAEKKGIRLIPYLA